MNSHNIIAYGCNIFPKLYWCGAYVGGTAEFDRPSGSGSSYESGYSSRKRARKEGLGGIDLNLPAEVVDRN